MTAIDIDQERESDESSVSHDKSHESDKKYEKYGESKEEGYEAYRTGQANEVVYDRYDSDYEGEQPGNEPRLSTCIPKESCCKKGGLSNMENSDSFS